MLKPGHVLGNRYKIIKTLGQGGQSNVYLLKDLRLKGKKWVGKEMVAQYTDPRDQALAKKHFEQEATMLATLEHVNLPKVMDYFSENGKHYLIMEYVQGEDLGRMIERNKKPFSEQDVASWAIQITTVLYYLHCQKQPIIFRDIKPSNIMVSRGSAKIIDFGIARHFNPAKKGDTLRIGSPGYSPPEQYSGQTDPRSDIYSLGVTMHHLLTGIDPASSQTPFQLPPIKAFNPDVSSKMISIVEKATQIDPDKRYQNALDMKKDLQLVADKGPSNKTKIAKPSGTPTIPHSPAGRTVITPPPVQDGGKMTKMVEAPDACAPVTTFMPAVDSEPVGGSPVPAGDPDSGLKLDPAQKTKMIPFRLIAIFIIFAGLLYLGYSNFPAVVGFFKPDPKTSSSASPEPSVSPHETPVEGQFLVEEGIAMYDQGRYREASALFRKALTLDTSGPVELMLLNNTYAKGGGGQTFNVAFLSDGGDEASRNQFLSGLVLAQQLTNYQGGIRGKKIVLRIVSEKALETALGEGVSGVIVRAGETGEKKAVALTEGKKMPLLVWGKPFDNKGNVVYLENCPPEIQFRAVASALTVQGIKNVAVIYDSRDEDGEFPLLQRELMDKDIAITTAFRYQRDKLGFDTGVEEIRAKKPGGIIMLGRAQDLNHCLKAIQSKKISIPVFVPPLLVTDELIRNLPPDKLNLVGVTPFGFSASDYRTAVFTHMFRSAFGNREPDTDGASGYDALNLLTMAGRRSFPDGESIYSFITSSEGKKFIHENAGTGLTQIYLGRETVLPVEKTLPKSWMLMKGEDGVWKEMGGFKL